MEERQERVKQLIGRIEKDRGFIFPSHKLLAERDPEFMEMWHNSLMHVFYDRKALPRKYKEILAVCLDAVTGFEQGLRAHLQGALAAGATEEEILEALELTTLMGLHSLIVNMPLLVEEATAYREKQAKTK